MVLKPDGEAVVGQKFSDIFQAEDCEKAIALARQKFRMIYDDLRLEFKDDDSPEVYMKIVGCEEENAK